VWLLAAYFLATSAVDCQPPALEANVCPVGSICTAIKLPSSFEKAYVNRHSSDWAKHSAQCARKADRRTRLEGTQKHMMLQVYIEYRFVRLGCLPCLLTASLAHRFHICSCSPPTLSNYQTCHSSPPLLVPTTQRSPGGLVYILPREDYSS
jgi:hypothetical protein